MNYGKEKRGFFWWNIVYNVRGLCTNKRMGAWHHSWAEQQLLPQTAVKICICEYWLFVRIPGYTLALNAPICFHRGSIVDLALQNSPRAYTHWLTLYPSRKIPTSASLPKFCVCLWMMLRKVCMIFISIWLKYRWFTGMKQLNWLLSYHQGFHASWKVLDFFLKIPGPRKFWKITLGQESPGKISLKIMLFIGSNRHHFFCLLHSQITCNPTFIFVVLVCYI